MSGSDSINWNIFKHISFLVLVAISPKLLGDYSIGVIVVIILGITLTPSKSVDFQDKILGIIWQVSYKIKSTWQFVRKQRGIRITSDVPLKGNSVLVKTKNCSY